VIIKRHFISRKRQPGRSVPARLFRIRSRKRLKLSRDLHFAMHSIIRVNSSSDKSDHNRARGNWGCFIIRSASRRVRRLRELRSSFGQNLSRQIALHRHSPKVKDPRTTQMGTVSELSVHLRCATETDNVVSFCLLMRHVVMRPRSVRKSRRELR
jgi:hypothetical protein